MATFHAKECQMCGFDFFSEMYLNQHIEAVHAAVKLEQIVEVKLDNESEEFSDSGDFEEQSTNNQIVANIDKDVHVEIQHVPDIDKLVKSSKNRIKKGSLSFPKVVQFVQR